LNIRESTIEDLKDVLEVERLAFGEDEEAELVNALLVDPTAQPLVSLIAIDSKRAVGHIMFTSVSLTEPSSEIKCALLAPLAVVPEKQKMGIGGDLIHAGLAKLKDAGVELVFVLGHPEYYPRHGFVPAGILGFEAPYPIDDKNADAWMVQALRQGIIGSVRAKVVCAEALQDPKYWSE
jgi:putative acetyltransferase